MKKLVIALAILTLQMSAMAQLGRMSVGKLQGALSGGNKVTTGTIDVMVNGKNVGQNIPEGTQTYVLRCHVNPEVGEVKKAMGVNDYTYQLVVQITNSNAKKDIVGSNVEVINQQIESLDEMVSQGYMDIELTTRDLLAIWKGHDAALPNDELVLKAEFRLVEQGAIVSSSELKTQNTGGWEQGQVTAELKEYQNGGQYFYNGNSAEWSRMVKYSKEHYADAEILHVKVLSSEMDSDGRKIFDIMMTMIKEGEIMRVGVSVWENKGATTLSKFVPQTVDALPGGLIAKKDQFRNVK